MATVVKTTFQLRRGNAEVWARNNPILERGEPGFEIDTGRLKIGNGETAWNDLAYQDENSVFNASTHYEFPSIGRANVLYKAESEKKIYQWSTINLKYEALEMGESI